MQVRSAIHYTAIAARQSHYTDYVAFFDLLASNNSDRNRSKVHVLCAESLKYAGVRDLHEDATEADFDQLFTRLTRTLDDVLAQPEVRAALIASPSGQPVRP